VCLLSHSDRCRRRAEGTADSSLGRMNVFVIEVLPLPHLRQDYCVNGPRILQPDCLVLLTRSLHPTPVTLFLQAGVRYTMARIACSFFRGGNHLQVTCKSAYSCTVGVHPECVPLRTTGSHPRQSTCVCVYDALSGPVADTVIQLMLCNAVQLQTLPATPPTLFLPGPLSRPGRTDTLSSILGTLILLTPARGPSETGS
jgi:hypothetical protein